MKLLYSRLFLMRFVFISLFHLPGYLILHAQLIPSYSITVCTKQSTGYYFLTPTRPNITATNSASYNMILDKEGELVYFKKFTAAIKACDFKLQANGLLSYYSNGKFYLMNSSFVIVDSVFCKNGVLPDIHDLQILSNGHFLLLGLEDIPVNLSAHKLFKPNNCAGSTSASVSCGVIQEQDANKRVVFEWHSKKHFKFLDIDTFYISDPKKVDWTHFNAVEQDKDGNFLVSLRNFNQVIKVRRSDSTLMWRLGGVKNDFTFLNDPGMFVGQHDIRRLPNGNITLFDNGRARPALHAAIAKEYRLDEKKRTAELVWSYVNDSTAQSSQGRGNVQRLANGNTLVSYGISDRSNVVCTVVNQQGAKQFEISFSDTLCSYRAFNFSESSLKFKRPVIKTFTEHDQLYLDAGPGFSKYLWSTGATTQTLPVTKSGKYTVFIATADGGYLASLSLTIEDTDLPPRK